LEGQEYVARNHRWPDIAARLEGIYDESRSRS
jgi:hypothetical protein